MSIVAIKAALEGQLKAIAPEIPTAWENADYTPVVGTPFQAVTLLPAEPDNNVLSPNYQERGLMQVTLNYPVGKGAKDALARAKLIRESFPRGLTLAAEENLINFSEEFDDPFWTPQHCNVIADNAVAPDGLTTADRITEDSADDLHSIIAQPLVILPSTAYTFSAHVQAAGRVFATLRHDGGAGNFGTGLCTYFSLTTGAVTQATAGITGSSVLLPGGWWRLRVTGISNVGSTTARPVIGLADSGTGSAPADFYLGDGASSLNIWGAQFNKGSELLTYRRSTSVTGKIATIIERTPEIGPGSPEGPWFQLPIRVRYYANIPS